MTVDAQDNIYVTDSQSGKIFVFDPNGKYRRVIGSLKGGEGYFKRPTGIAVDSAAQRIYVTDTLRHKIFVMDMQGSVLATIGKNGTGDGEFNYPTELRLQGPDLVVVDAMNFRVQVLDRSGAFKYAIGKPGDGVGWMFRPKGISFDSEGHLYIANVTLGRGAGVRPRRPSTLLLRTEGRGRQAITSCRPGSKSTAPIAFMWSTRLIIACKSFTIPEQEKHAPGKGADDGGNRTLALPAPVFKLRRSADHRCPGDAQPQRSEWRMVSSQGSLGCTFCHAPHSGLGGVTPLWGQKGRFSKAGCRSVRRRIRPTSKKGTLGPLGHDQQPLPELSRDRRPDIRRIRRLFSGPLPVVGSMNAIDSSGPI